MTARKPSLIASFFLFTMTLGIQATYDNNNSSFEDESYFDYDFADYDLGSGPLRTSCSFADVLVPAANECGLIDILKENFYCKTYPLNERSLLDEPLLYPNTFAKKDQWIIEGSFFFNQTNRCFFDKSHDTIAAYLAFTNNSLITKIETAFNKIMTQEDCRTVFITMLNLDPSIFDTNIRELACLFGKASIQERRAGLFFQAQKNKGKFSLGIKVPLYWIERNFFFTDQEQQEIQDTGLFPQGSEDVAEQFSHEHLIGDKIGIGDTRITLGYQAVDRDRLALYLGPYATIPTALPIQQGIMGSQFHRCAPRPTIDLCDLANIDASATFKNFGKDFINKIASMLLEQPLGNSGHFGLGLFIQPYLRVWEHLVWHHRASLEYLFPGNENKRLFIKKVDLNAFAERDFSSDNDQIAESNLNFLKERLLDMLFPECIPAYVQPGPIINLTSMLDFKKNEWGINLGSDFWFQSREHLRFFDITPHHLNMFDIEKGIKPAAMQLKFLGGLSYTLNKPNRDWVVSFNGDKTVWSSGIGRDFMVTARFAVTW